MATTAKKPTAKKAAATKPTPRKKAASPRRTTTAARDRKILELRQTGMPFAAIAAKLKIRSRDDAHAGYERALAETLPLPSDEQRRVELDKIDQQMTPLWPKAMRGDSAAIAQLSTLSIKRTQIAGEAKPLPELPTEQERGPVERATALEVELLRMSSHTLAASALVMARFVDITDDSSVAAATAARELRQTMTNLRNLAGLAGDHSQGGSKGEGTVVPESRLAEVRRRAAARGATKD